jgi:hypothetical protein
VLLLLLVNLSVLESVGRGQIDCDRWLMVLDGLLVLVVRLLDLLLRLENHWRLIALVQRWVIAIKTKIQLPNTLPIILNCVISIIS